MVARGCDGDTRERSPARGRGKCHFLGRQSCGGLPGRSHRPDWWGARPCPCLPRPIRGAGWRKGTTGNDRPRACPSEPGLRLPAAASSPGAELTNPACVQPLTSLEAPRPGGPRSRGAWVCGGAGRPLRCCWAASTSRAPGVGGSSPTNTSPLCCTRQAVPFALASPRGALRPWGRCPACPGPGRDSQLRRRADGTVRPGRFSSPTASRLTLLRGQRHCEACAWFPAKGSRGRALAWRLRAPRAPVRLGAPSSRPLREGQPRATQGAVSVLRSPQEEVGGHREDASQEAELRPGMGSSQTPPGGGGRGRMAQLARAFPVMSEDGGSPGPSLEDLGPECHQHVPRPSVNSATPSGPILGGGRGGLA